MAAKKTIKVSDEVKASNALKKQNFCDRDALLTTLDTMVRDKLPEDIATLVSIFIRQFFATISIEDLQGRELDDLYGTILSTWNQLYQRAKHEKKLRIYNPNYEQYGWQSTHTIIEIIQDDMPFLVDSIQMELNRRGIYSHIIFHVGAMKVMRDQDNKLTQIYPMGSDAKNTTSEAVIYCEIDKQSDPNLLDELRETILHILDDVQATVEDWPKMLANVDASIEALEKFPPKVVDKPELDEAKDFLRWVANNHFTILGWREYKLVEENKDKVLKVIPETGLGVLRGLGAKKVSKRFSDMPTEAREQALKHDILMLGKTNTKSTVHRPAYTDYISIKQYNAAGEIVGEKRIVGLYTSIAYNSRPYAIPVLRQKVRDVMQRSKLSSTGHAGKALLNILETLPRDDLIQASVDELLTLAIGILHIQERRRIRLFIRQDVYQRYVSCLLYVPRDRYNTQIRHLGQNILMDAYNGTEVSYATHFSESVLTRIHYIIRLDKDNLPKKVDVLQLEKKLVEVARAWEDELFDCLIEHFGEETGNSLFNKYKRAFPAGYIEAFHARKAVYDIEHMEGLANQDSLQMSFYRTLDEPETSVRFKLFRLNQSMPLSDVLPVLENMGLRVEGEQPYTISFGPNSYVGINDFSMVSVNQKALNVEHLKDVFQESFAKIWFGNAENDAFNKLVLFANLNWREVAVLRAYAKYFKQIGFTFSQSYIEETFSKHPQLAYELIELFKLRFDPNRQARSKKALPLLVEKIEQQLESVESLDEDRIIRRYLELIHATLRTNFFQKVANNAHKSYISFKLDPEKISDLPLPKPMYEIFVYSPKIEGVHLRGGKVARGGLRWSDRKEDFRTEILGLMKAQRVKNSVIVPAGAKGGFIVKDLPETGSREDILNAGIACYKTFISGLLDITDNRKGDKVITPQNTVCYDGEDPYLVVAADKGTATFSDYANGVSGDYDFWLGDAFASGGKTGYDHKKMGITAKGAWESVKRHFRELGLNTQQEDFTVVGIGDMAGDVFGNGMLLSKHIKLLGAFNHLHIFVDPNPDPMQSYKERQRLFDLPRSGWDDYNSELISQGGGIYSRKAKSIRLSQEIKKVFNISRDIVEPNELINAMLCAQVDLLWNGGIGTFVKDVHETNEDVGDKANDQIRINGDELRARVVGEGGNLGLTQLGRVAYALSGGKIATDFIDNSAGVDCSDHEVNIKILLNQIVDSGDLTEKQRNSILSDMTDDVGRLVLKNNYTQTEALSLTVIQAQNNLDLYKRLIDELEAENKLDRSIEFLPDEKEIQERKANGLSLTEPELAVLMAYTKIILKEDLLNSDIPEDPYISKIVFTAFPAILKEKYEENIMHHSLNKEIIATQLSNMVINYGGVRFLNRVIEQTGAKVPEIVRAFIISAKVFNLESLWNQIETLDYKITSEIQYEMMFALGQLLHRGTRWLLRSNEDLSDVQTTISTFERYASNMMQNLRNLLQDQSLDKYNEALNFYQEADVPATIAEQVATIKIISNCLEILTICHEHQFTFERVTTLYFTLAARLELGWIKEIIYSHKDESHWDTLAKFALCDDIDRQQRDLTINLLYIFKEFDNIDEAISLWSEQHDRLIGTWTNIVAELKSCGAHEFSMFTVAVKKLLDLTQASTSNILLPTKAEEEDPEKKCA